MEAAALTVMALGLVLFVAWVFWFDVCNTDDEGEGNQFAAFWNAHAKWSQQTFGPDDQRGPIGPLKHLRKEVKEIRAAIELYEEPHVVEEFADAMLLLCDSARRFGLTPEEYMAACVKKLEKNKTRKWPNWKDYQNQPVEHDRSNES